MRTTSLPLAVVGAWALFACGDDARHGFDPQPDPELGATSFVSAARPGGSEFRGPDYDVPTDANGDGGERTIEEGDIYRVMDAGRILNLNSYRGLQVIDASDPAAPAVIGALRLSGTPVELYVVGARALVLVNDWYGYWGSRYAPEHGKEQGGAVLLVDLTDPTRPEVLDRVVVTGSIMKSRLARGASDVVYVAAALWRVVDDGAGGVVATGSSERTIVASVELGATTLTPRGELDLGGWVSDIQATPTALLVARTDWSASDATSRVALVDISAPDGTMVAGADVAVAGQVKGQFNLDLRGHILRVVSEGSWGAARENHLETFDVADPLHPVAVDHATFGAGESLFATLFVGDDKAFFVTYLRQDPFHAFHIDADGHATAMSELVVSGWNDFFTPVFGDTHLVGVGIDDAGGGREVAVSLYDIRNMTNPDPLVDREGVALSWSWSEASWDHRAFSVLEDAVDVTAPDGTTEHGLVLLPFAGWADDAYRSGVQLFSFSPTTVTERGMLAHEEPVRRGFLADDAVAACLSDTVLGLHDVSDPDAPLALGHLALAPSYTSFDVYGGHGLRHADTASWSWWGTAHDPPPGRAEVVSLADDPDSALPLAGFDVPPGASVTRVGSLAVVMTSAWEADATQPDGGDWWTTITTWDLADPHTPTPRGSLVTAALPPRYGGWGYPVDALADACFDCWGRAAPRGTVVGDAIVFMEGITESEPAGERTYCTTTPPEGTVVVEDPDDDPIGGPSEAWEATVWYSGSIACVRDDGGPETCYGAIYACHGLDAECVEVTDPTSIGATTECVTQPTLRYWTRWVVHVLDVSAPSAPTVCTPLELPRGEEGVATLADGATLWITTREPWDVAGDARDYVRYWARPIDLTTPAVPVVGARVNVPGRLLAVTGHDLYTIDDVYAEDHVESAVSRCTVEGDVATLVARHRVTDRQIAAVQLDGAGHLLVSHGPIHWWYGGGGAVDVAVAPAETASAASDDAVAWETQLTLLDALDLGALATVPVDSWAELGWAGVGRALFQVPGGLLVMNTEDAGNPWPQAWFATLGWPEQLVVSGTHVYFAAGRYGVYGFDLDTFNLLPPPTAR